MTCTRCKQEREGLPRAPFPGPLGEEVLGSACAACWSLWLAEQTLQMNEKRLSLGRPEHRDQITALMRRFLCLDGGEAPPPTRPPDPPPA